MPYICDNPACPNHIELATREANVPYIDTVRDGFVYRIERYLYGRHDSPDRIYFCHACHTAVQLTRRSNNGNNRAHG